MDCKEAGLLLTAFVDNELDLRTQAEISSHLAGCPTCTREFESQQTVHKAFDPAELYYAAPPGLAERIRRATQVQAPASESQLRGMAWGWRWLPVAASLVLAATAGWILISKSRQPAGPILADEIVSSHIRSLMLAHATDVPSSDQHTVKPWFDGKLDYSPPVPDLASEGFPLIGGRLDYIAGRPVAALVYQRRKHIISVYVWPLESRSAQSPTTVSQKGYNLTHWSSGGMAFWAVSDLNTAELSRFLSLFETAGTPRPPF